MAIIQVTPQAEIAGTIDERITNLDKAVIHCMEVAREEGVNEARAHGEYTDQSGNLRSSTGGVIAYKGEIISSSSFDKVKNGDEGARTGKIYLKSIVEKILDKISLALGAGRDYAPYLQAKGRKVLGDAEEVTKRSLTKQFNDLGLKRK